MINVYCLQSFFLLWFQGSVFWVIGSVSGVSEVQSASSSPSWILWVLCLFWWRYIPDCNYNTWNRSVFFSERLRRGSIMWLKPQSLLTAWHKKCDSSCRIWKILKQTSGTNYSYLGSLVNRNTWWGNALYCLFVLPVVVLCA